MTDSNGAQFWYRNDLLHRRDGPAVKLANGKVFWYLNGDLFPSGKALKRALEGKV